jgi:4-hydroxybenzoate polyprenyltransferase
VSEAPAGFLPRWAAFVAERFPPARHLLMAGAFFAGNAAAAVALTGGWLRPVTAICGGAATLLIFLRLRIFDEIKDCRTDRDVHPERPLARGLIAPAEAWRVALAVAGAELLLALGCGLPALIAWAAVFGFSLLMFREFFIGAWLRPKMELYAAAHTLVAGWMGLFVAAAVSGQLPWELPARLWIFLIANWAVFNVFEFARKTWAPEEERPGVESYSGRLRPAGAALLAVGQVLPAAALAWPLLAGAAGRTPALWTAALMAAIPTAAASIYVLSPGRSGARLYRGAMTLFIVGYYLALAAVIWAGRRGT